MDAEVLEQGAERTLAPPDKEDLVLPVIARFVAEEGVVVHNGGPRGGCLIRVERLMLVEYIWDTNGDWRPGGFCLLEPSPTLH